MTSCRPFLWQRCSSPPVVVTSVQGCQTIPFLKFSDYLTSHYPHCHSTATLLVSRDVNLEVLRLSASHQRYYPVLHLSTVRVTTSLDHQLYHLPYYQQDFSLVSLSLITLRLFHFVCVHSRVPSGV